MHFCADSKFKIPDKSLAGDPNQAHFRLALSTVVICCWQRKCNHSRIEYVFAFCAFLLFCCFAFKSLVMGKIKNIFTFTWYFSLCLHWKYVMFNNSLTSLRRTSTSNCHHAFRKDIFLLDFKNRLNVPIWYIYIFQNNR